jgi:transcriptional regulator with XRE-family HTH domain
MARRRNNVDDDIAEGKRDETGARLPKYANYKEGKDYAAPDQNIMNAILAQSKKSVERNRRRRTGPYTRGGKDYDTVEDLENEIIAYWDYLMEQNENGITLIPDVEGLAAFLGVTRNTLNNWENKNRNGFAETVAQAKNAIAAAKKQIGLRGYIPPLVLAMDFNNNHGYTQKQEVVITPNNPLGDAKSNEELMSEYQQLAQLSDGDLPTLPEQ